MRRLINLIEDAEAAPDIRIEGEMIIASLAGKDVAWYPISRRTDSCVSLHANVDADARRQGISKAVYDWAERHFAKEGLKLVPSNQLSNAAYLMWQKRDPSSVEGHRPHQSRGTRTWLRG